MDMHALVADPHTSSLLGTVEQAHSLRETVSMPGRDEDTEFSAEDKGHRVWAIVHEKAFARTFTEIAEELNKLIAYSKFILGEDKLC